MKNYRKGYESMSQTQKTLITKLVVAIWSNKVNTVQTILNHADMYPNSKFKDEVYRLINNNGKVNCL